MAPVPRYSYPTPHSRRNRSTFSRIRENLFDPAVKETSRYRAVKNEKPKNKKISKRKLRFIKSVKEVMAGEDATQHMHRYSVVDSLVTWATDTQTCFDFGLFGGQGGGGNWDDLLQCIQNSFASTVDEESFIELKGAHLHYTIRNTQASEVIDMDSYEFICIKDLPIGLRTSLSDFFVETVAEQGTTGVGGTQLTFATPGVNPYTVAGTFMQYWKLQKKQKIYLPPSEAIDGSIALHFKHKKVMGKEVLGTTSMLAKAGITKAKMFIVNNISWNASEGGNGLRYNWTKALTYKAQDIKTRGAGLV